MPSVRISIKALRSMCQRHRLADLRVVERRCRGIHDQVGADIAGPQLADRLGRLLGHVLHQRHGDVAVERHVELASHETQYARRPAVDDAHLDGVEERPALLPVVGIAHELDRYVAIEFGELERPRADRLGAHVALRHMTRVDGRKSRREQHQERRLRMSKMEGGFMIAVRRHFLEVVVPDLARVAAELLSAILAQERVPCALHVLGRERFAVVPLHALAQLESQLGLAVVPCPARSQVGHDCLQAVQRLVLVEQHQIVEYGHERLNDRDGRLLMHGRAGWIVAMIDAERAALLLRRRGFCNRQQHREGHTPQSAPGAPASFPPSILLGVGTLGRCLVAAILARTHRTQTRRAARPSPGPDQTARLPRPTRWIRAPDQLCKGPQQANRAVWEYSGRMRHRPWVRHPASATITETCLGGLPHKSSVRLRPGHVCGVIENDNKSKTGHAASVRRG